MNVTSLVERLIPNLAQARASVEGLRRKYPSLSDEELVNHVIHNAKMRAASTGAVTGMASSPITMIPAALADMAAVLAIEGTMVAEIGVLLAPDAFPSPDTIKADVIGVVFPAAASQALRQFGIRAGEKLTQSIMRKYATEDFLRAIVGYSARYLGKQITREAIMTKAVPLVGMGIGAGWNWLEVKAIGARAIRYYSDEPIGPTPTPLAQAGELWNKVRQYLPGKHSRSGEPSRTPPGS